jgi:hypothetical protein
MYTRQHRHSGIAMMTPHDVHHGLVDKIVERRTETLALARHHHPERFVQRIPATQRRPSAAWINPPSRATELVAAAH